VQPTFVTPLTANLTERSGVYMMMVSGHFSTAGYRRMVRRPGTKDLMIWWGAAAVWLGCSAGGSGAVV
jgi:hypothetical protein